MILTLKALFDDETRKQLRDQILGQAKAIAREEVAATVTAEIKRVFSTAVNKYNNDTWAMKGLVQSTIKDLLTSRWDELAQMVEAQINKIVAEKLKNKTVWEAEKQEEYVRKIARQELRKSIQVEE